MDLGGWLMRFPESSRYPGAPACILRSMGPSRFGFHASGFESPPDSKLLAFLLRFESPPNSKLLAFLLRFESPPNSKLLAFLLGFESPPNFKLLAFLLGVG